jgi:NADH-quinone oxidoreductase subunit J
MIPVLVFFGCALLAVAGAIALILAREPIHSALSLIVVMLALAVLYLLLGAPFVAAVQILVYAGAVMVLFVFVIMLLNAGEEERTNISKLAHYVGWPLGIFLTVELVYWMLRAPIGARATTATIAPGDPTRDLSMLLFRSYLFPFEITSILILIALIGALVLAKRDS